MDAGIATEIRLKKGKGVKITAPVVLILPENSNLRSCILHAIMLGNGEIEAVVVPSDSRKPR